MYDLAKAYRSIEKPLPIAEPRTGKPAMVTLKIQLDFSMVHDTTLWANIFVRSHLGCGTNCVFICFCRSHKYFKDAKGINKQNFENKLNLTCQAQSTPKTIGINQGILQLWPNLVVLAWTGDELSRGQVQNGVNFDFEVEFDLEGQGQSPPQNKWDLNQGLFTYGPHLVIVAWTGDELSRGQTWWRTGGMTDRPKQWQYPEANTGLG